MAYTPHGPWNNGSAPGLDASFFNDVETQLVSLNTAATDGNISSASGVLSAINALLSGGKIGKSVAGDILDASTTTTNLNGVVQINLQINGATIGTVTTAGLNFAGSYVTTDKIRLQVGSLTRIKLFTGTGTGTFTHGLGATPDFVSLVANNTTGQFGYNSPNSTTVGINVSPTIAWVAMAFAFN